MVPNVAGSNPVIRPRNKKIAQRAFFYFCARMRMRTGEKAVRTAAKRRTTVRRLCECTILPGGAAIRSSAPQCDWAHSLCHPVARCPQNDCLCGMLFNHGAGLLKKSTAPHTGCGHTHVRIGVLFCERIIHF